VVGTGTKYNGGDKEEGVAAVTGTNNDGSSYMKSVSTSSVNA
jgi:hypothetical protein